ncbi:putative pilus system protein FilC [Acinetobacter sp. WZC-1]|uniref:putative pilus system protein FilC n=1 Tax=Acinetobacter sp. WZC-1 TaxID=3459034 RepID=UPI00403D87C3
MNNHWMKKTLLVLSIQLVTGGVYAAETADAVAASADHANDQTDQSPATHAKSVESKAVSTASPDQQVQPVAEPARMNQDETPSLVPAAGSQAATALQQQEGDATQETNLQEVFTSNERQYSLIKKGDLSTFYDLDYSYYRDTQINAAINNGTPFQLRVDEDANHTLSNTFTMQYGVLDNLTLTASVPLIAKSDNLKDTSTAGLGDISFGARWEPFPLKTGRLPLILFGNVSTKTGDSPYEINPQTDLSTGKGYYSVGLGASTRKYIDPVVLFASVSANYGFKESGLDQPRGGDENGPRYLEEFDPGVTGGFSFGFAYSFNYDVSMTMSYQQSFNTNTSFTYRPREDGRVESYKAADQTSAMFSIALGVRVSPETIVNGTLGIGLTEDSPDVSLGLSFPLDILGLSKKKAR